MIEANMLEAKTRLSKLVGAAERGEEVILKRNGKAVAKIVPIAPRKFRFGFLRDQTSPIEDSVMFGSMAEIFDGTPEE